MCVRPEEKGRIKIRVLAQSASVVARPLFTFFLIIYFYIYWDSIWIELRHLRGVVVVGRSVGGDDGDESLGSWVMKRKAMSIGGQWG